MKKFVVVIVAVLFLVLGITVFTWMSSDNRARKPATVSNSPDSETPTRLFSADEVAQHSTPDDCWTIINGSVYDVTEYVSKHPGGARIIQACGKDATSLFATQGNTGGRHSATASSILEQFKIGSLQ